jgi:hypothetical protein
MANFDVVCSELPVQHLQQQRVSQFSGFFGLHCQWTVCTSKNGSLREGVLIVLAI